MDERRYRDAERRLWQDAGIAPTEHQLHLRHNDVDVRVQEIGSGPPVLFIHGGPGAAGAAWAYLAARLPDLRCLLLDRPGTGLSGAQPLASPAAVRREAETLVADVLDALGIDQAHVVGSSHGSYVALLSSAAQPDRIDRTVHLGCPGFVEGMALRASDRLVLLPGAAPLFGRMPVSERSVRATMRQLGHDAATTGGRLPSALVDWCLALSRYTDTMRNELGSMANMGTFRRGFDPALTVEPELLDRVTSPTYLLWGDADPFGDEAVAQRLTDLLPVAQLEMMPGAGHLCWFDDVEHAAEVVRRHTLG